MFVSCVGCNSYQVFVVPKLNFIPLWEWRWQWCSHWGSRGAESPLDNKAKKLPKIGKKREKIRKKQENGKKIGKIRKNWEGSFTLPLLTDTAGYVTGRWHRNAPLCVHGHYNYVFCTGMHIYLQNENSTCFSILPNTCNIQWLYIHSVGVIFSGW